MTATDLDAGLLLCINGDRYTLRVLPRDGFARGWSVAKEGSSRPPYEVRDSPGKGSRCTCTAAKFGKVCRHIKALRKVGLL